MSITKKTCVVCDAEFIIGPRKIDYKNELNNLYKGKDLCTKCYLDSRDEYTSVKAYLKAEQDLEKAKRMVNEGEQLICDAEAEMDENAFAYQMWGKKYLEHEH